MPLKPLSPEQIRVIGCLIEKSLTTPELYPLSLNALTNACNQKSNRDPVVDFAEAQVQDVAEGLVSAGLVSAQTGFGSRVAKYKHRFCNTEFSELQMSDQEVGIVAVLFLRGPQTPGELRTRTNRLCEFESLGQVESTLARMQDKGWVMRLEREPGKREARYAHLFTEPSAAETPAETTPSAAPSESPLAQKVTRLEAKLDSLEQRLAELEARLN